MDAELIHNVYDTDSRFSINPTSRLITKISEGDVKLVQYDHNSERFAFEIPREVDGHDMSLCTSIVIHYINVGDAEYNDGIYDVEDVQVDPEDENKVIFSWLISQNATMYNGALNFAIRFKCVNDTGATVYVWNTLPFTDMTVGATMDNTDSVISQRADILEQWRRTLFKPEFIDEIKAETIDAVKEHVDNAIINPGDTVDINITGNAATSDEATHATNADHADEATHATNADEATHATNADVAQWADSAGLADTAVYATNADEATHATDAHNAEWANSAGVADTAVTASKADEATHATNADEATHATNADHADEATHATNADETTHASNADHATNADNARISDMALSLVTYKTDFYNAIKYGPLLNIATFTFPSYGSGVQVRLAISSELPYSVSGILELHASLGDFGYANATLRWDALNDIKFEDMFRVAKEEDGSFSLYVRFLDVETEPANITITVLSKNSIYNGDFGWMYYSPGLTDDYSFPEPSENVIATSVISSAFALKRDISSGIECTAEGDSVALPDSADALLKGLRVMGKTEQVKTNGYQLFDASKIPTPIGDLDGMTITYNDDGSFSFSGTPTNSTGVNYTLSRSETIRLIKQGDICISNVPDNCNPYFYVRLTKAGASSSERIEVSTSSGASGRIKNFPAELLNDPEYYVTMGIYVRHDRDITVNTLKPMLYQDGDGTWEPYTGGKPSPGINNVKSRNLFKLIADKTTTASDTTVTGVANESFVTINGTCSNEQAFTLTTESTVVSAGKTYTVSVYGLNTVSDQHDRLYIHSNGAVIANFVMTGSPVTFTAETDMILSASIVIQAGSSYNNKKVYIQIEEGETATPWMSYFEPYIESYPQPLESIGDDDSVDVNVCGKNMVDIHNPYSVITGTSYTVNDGIATIVRGTAVYAPSIYYDLGEYRSWVGKTLTISATSQEDTGTSGANSLIYVNGTKGTNNQVSIIKTIEFKTNSTTKYTVTIPENSECETLRIRLYFQNLKNSDEKAVFSNFQVELGEASTLYEPFKPIQTLTISTPNGLPGIPVSSGGNYTDENGQQWICDEVDFGRKLYVSRIEKIMLNGSEVWKTWGVNNKVEGLTGFYMFLDVNKPLFTPYQNKNILCSHMNSAATHGGSMTGCGIFDTNKPYAGICVSNDFLEDVSSNEAAITSFKKFLSLNNMSVIYAISPIETQLSDEQIAQYKALHTYKPNTTIQNSDNAYMAVKYAADTKAYIDKKYAELASMMANVSSQII